MGTGEKRVRRVAPPERGWTLGAEGLPKGFWAVMTILLLGLAGFILWQGYHTYAILVAVLAGAASVNLR
jgi:hypothetical protein